MTATLYRYYRSCTMWRITHRLLFRHSFFFSTLRVPRRLFSIDSLAKTNALKNTTNRQSPPRRLDIKSWDISKNGNFSPLAVAATAAMDSTHEACFDDDSFHSVEFKQKGKEFQWKNIGDYTANNECLSRIHAWNINRMQLWCPMSFVSFYSSVSRQILKKKNN